MKLFEVATLGVRVVGVAAIVFGVILALTTGVMGRLLPTPLADAAGSDLHLHDTYFVVSDLHYDLLVPSGIGLVVGVTLLVMSRPLGKLLIRGLEKPTNGPEHL